MAGLYIEDRTKESLLYEGSELTASQELTAQTKPKFIAKVYAHFGLQILAQIVWVVICMQLKESKKFTTYACSKFGLAGAIVIVVASWVMVLTKKKYKSNYLLFAVFSVAMCYIMGYNALTFGSNNSVLLGEIIALIITITLYFLAPFIFKICDRDLQLS